MSYKAERLKQTIWSPLNWLDNWFKRQCLHCKHQKIVVSSSLPNPYCSLEWKYCHPFEKQAFSWGAGGGTLLNILWDHTCISGCRMGLHMYSLPCDWIYTCNMKTTVAFCYVSFYIYVICTFLWLWDEEVLWIAPTVGWCKGWYKLNLA